ncbi:MAG TPA: ABC transporter permease [Gaiellaceae bacterium]|nr:ABC transporter permease [Gaiellaceae bacterium]
MIRDFRNVAFAVGWRTIHNVFHNPSLLFPGLAFPLINFAAFAGGLSRLRHVPGFDYAPGYSGFQFCFVLLQSAAFGGVFTGFGIARDFEYGFARRLLLSATRRSGIIAGYAIGALVRYLLTAAVVTGVAIGAGMRIKGNGIDLVGVYTLAVLVNVAFLLWACGVAMRFQSVQAGPIMQTPVFLILFFAPVYVPLDLLRGWIHSLAVANPLTRLIEAVRSLLAGHPAEVGAAYGVGFALIALFALWALAALRSAEARG